MNSDHVFVKNFELPCRIGTTSEERAFPQILQLSFCAELSLAKAGRSDNLKDTVDYAQIIEGIRFEICSREFVLVEAVAETVAKIILKDPLVRAAEVSIGKKVFAGIESVGAFIRREKK